MQGSVKVHPYAKRIIIGTLFKGAHPSSSNMEYEYTKQLSILSSYF